MIYVKNTNINEIEQFSQIPSDYSLGWAMHIKATESLLEIARRDILAEVTQNYLSQYYM